MQWVKDGPNIPERLLQAHEDGRVVFFCGAGISNLAGLPRFKKLVNKLYKRLHEPRSEAERDAITAGNLDTAIGMLEARIVGERERVRCEIAKLLTPDLTRPKATATHEALLELGKNRDGQTRLVTTNCDRLFEQVIGDGELPVETSWAPSLPVPKNRWRGLVYLHGLLPADIPSHELEHLVLSSGDFGRAYLTEGWAARFVTELFRNYTICFVGYSLGDPVLRYMMDALAADRALGDSEHEVFALGGFRKNKEEQLDAYWRARDVTPIPYPRCKQHSKLHETLHKWAETYKAGVTGKERIIVEYAHLRPHESTKQDDFVGRLIWALSDRSGLPAKKFALLDPVPSLEWLRPLFKMRFRHSDLERFGVIPSNKKDEELSFSVIRRPSPYTHSPWMDLMPFGRSAGTWDEVMGNLAHWLTRHLDDPFLVRWIVEHGQRLHDRFADEIQRRLTELGELEREGKKEELERIRSNAPSAVPRPLMRRIWSLMASGRLKQRDGPDLRNWWERCKCDGLTGTLRIELRHLLSPTVSFSRSIPFRESEQGQDSNMGTVEVKDVLSWEISLISDHVHRRLSQISREKRWQVLLPELLPFFMSHLRDTLDLMKDLGDANEKYDYSHLYQRSIEEHDQNSRIHDWTALIELTRDAWLKVAETAPREARLFAADWCNQPYPVFKRLCLFAATRADVVPQQQALEWLLADNAWWLWSNCTRREAIRLLVALAPRLESQNRDVVETAIISGPLREMRREDQEQEKFEREVWIRLSKLEAAGPELGEPAQVRLEYIRSRHPNWQMQEGDRDEFRVWTGTWSSEDNERHPSIRLPRELKQLVSWLRSNP